MWMLLLFVKGREQRHIVHLSRPRCLHLELSKHSSGCRCLAVSCVCAKIWSVCCVFPGAVKGRVPAPTVAFRLTRDVERALSRGLVVEAPPPPSTLGIWFLKFFAASSSDAKLTSIVVLPTDNDNNEQHIVACTKGKPDKKFSLGGLVVGDGP